eukprot:6178976-Pleurochrysis_carterae.AAC.7
MRASKERAAVGGFSRALRSQVQLSVRKRLLVTSTGTSLMTSRTTSTGTSLTTSLITSTCAAATRRYQRKPARFGCKEHSTPCGAREPSHVCAACAWLQQDAG